MNNPKKTTLKEIEIYSTDDLLDELFARYPDAVFVATREEKGQCTPIYTKRWEGSGITCLGLMAFMADEINGELNSRLEEVDMDSQ